MKKHYLLKQFITLCVILLGFTTLQGQTIVFQEDFSGFSDSLPNNDIASTLDNHTALTGWTGSRVYDFKGKVKMGTSSALGWIQTPAIDLSNDNGLFTLSFDATAWHNDSTTIKVYVNGTPTLVTGLSNVHPSSNPSYETMQHFTLTLTGGTAATTIKFEGKQAAKGRFFLDNVVITQNTGITSTAAPVFTPAAGTYTEPVSVTMSSATTGATIYYTLDGTTPTTSSSVYSAPITVSQTTTVKAFAVATGYGDSPVTSATYTFPAQVANIAAFKALTAGSQPYTIANDVTFVFHSGNYTYVKDATAGLLVYGPGFTTEFDEGDQISNLTGAFSQYQGQIEMTNVQNPAAATSNTGTVTPITVTMSELLANYSQYDAQLITLENVTFPNGFTGANSTDITQGSNQITLYKRFTLDTTLAANTVTNVTGFAAIYGTSIQIYPRNNQDLAATVPTPQPTLSITAPANGANFSSLDTLPVGINITNFVLGTDGYLKVESPLLTSAGLTNPLYLDQTGLTTLLQSVFSPLPAGTHTITAALVDMTQAPLTPAVSATTTFTVTMPQLPTPTFTPVAGTYADSVAVSIACGTTGAEIRYTTDGTEPTATSTLYANPITLTTTTTLKAKAFKNYWADSETATGLYTVVYEPVLTVSETALSFNSAQLTQTFTVSGAHLTDAIAITSSSTHFTASPATISNPNSNTTVTVTFDGTEPATGTLTVASGTLTHTIALTGTATLSAPVFTPASGASDTLIVVTINSDNASAQIRYTMDGTTPDATSTLYNSAITLNTVGEHTIKAIAMLSGWDNSEVVTATYTIVAPVPPTPDYNDTLLYHTGFEATDGFVAATVYNNPDVTFSGAAGHQWGTVFGTPATTGAIQGAQSMQMRWYVASATTLGYTYTNFDVAHASRIQFAAASTNGLNVNVSYSTDGGNTYSTPNLFELGSTLAMYNMEVSSTGSFDNVRFKFEIALPATAPTSTSRVYIDSVNIFGYPSAPSSTVEMPVITPNSGSYLEPVTVSMTCATAGAEIRYTTDGTTPTSTSTLYSAPFTVNTTTTVKAMAFFGSMTPSNVATATYTFPTEVANIAAFKAANTATNSTPYKITGDVTFVFQHGNNIYVQDATGGLLIFNQNGNITNEYNEGDVISGGICGTYSLYHGLVEMVPLANPATATSNVGAITPVEVDIETIEAQYYVYESRLVKLTDVVFTEGGAYNTSTANNLIIEQNGETLQCRNDFKTLDMTIPAGQHADIVGFVLQYEGNYQIAPRDNDDITFITVTQDTVATPVITITDNGDGNVTVAITCTTDGASIYYTLDGTMPDVNATLYTTAIPHDGGEFTVKAIAMKEGMVNSAVVTMTHTGIQDATIICTVYPNPTANVCHLTANGVLIESVQVHDTFGKLVGTMSVNDTEATLNLSGYATGLYQVRIVTTDGVVTTKIMKQ
ncbi:MAG: chitobiase/beta-hexosaminidase C-terminal domain-containing protein [Bacteroidales bacterium]|nr:chitobiase/beta-hexosaminidase C-terminal domain-containing protein [Bacteroidales bacterium]